MAEKLGFETGDAFSFRGGEQFTLRAFDQANRPRFAVMAATVQPLPAPSVSMTESGPVEQAAIIACQFVGGEWQWMQLAPDAKAAVGDMIFDHDGPKNVWLEMVVEVRRG